MNHFIYLAALWAGALISAVFWFLIGYMFCYLIVTLVVYIAGIIDVESTPAVELTQPDVPDYDMSALKDAYILRLEEFRRETLASFPEDSHLENGNYRSTCVCCGKSFTGYKRRCYCKICSK